MKKNNKLSKYLLVGSPNVGKSTYYNKITWKVAPVANIDRVTTFASVSRLRNTKNIQVIDLPGVNTLTPQGDDEKETFRYIFNTEYNGVISIVGATTLKRDLNLVFELAEAGVLSMILVNMIDELGDVSINKLQLTKEFKVITECISAKRNFNVKNSLTPLLNSTLKKQIRNLIYNNKIEKLIAELAVKIKHPTVSSRFIIIQALCQNDFALEYLVEQKLFADFNELVTKYKINEVDIYTINQTRATAVDKLLDKVYTYTSCDVGTRCLVKQNKYNSYLNDLFLNKWFAIPIFLIIMCGIYFLTFYEYTGGWIQAQFAENALGALQTLIIDKIAALDPGGLQNWWGHFVGDGMLGGVFTIISFLPWLIILLALITILEQVGLLSRMSIVFDNTFNKFGISGRALVNLITGLGCNVPAITTTRNANSIKERVVISMLSPFVSCSARVVVFAFLSEAIVATNWTWLITLGLSAFSIVFALLMGYFFSNLLFRKSNSVFMIELSKLRSPDIFVVVKKVIMDSYDFIIRTIIIVGISNLVIWVLLYTSPTNQFYIDPVNQADIDTSFLRYISYPFQYLLYPTGLGLDWRFSVSLLAAFPAKEIAASNIDTLFNGIAGFKEATGILPMALTFSYICFFSFYVPCMATVAVMAKEIGWKYTMSNIAWSLGISYILSLFVFSVFGGMELLIITPSISSLLVLVTLLCIIVCIYFIIVIYKNYRWKQATIWSLSSFKMYNYSIYVNTGLLAMTSICLSGVVLANL